MKIERLTIVFYVKDRMGILSDILDVYQGHNISLNSVYTSCLELEGLGVITIEVFSNRKYIESISIAIGQIEGVKKCILLRENELVHRKVALYKFSTNAFLGQSLFQEVIGTNQAHIVEINQNEIIMAKVGEEHELAHFHKSIRNCGFLQQSISSRASMDFKSHLTPNTGLHFKASINPS